MWTARCDCVRKIYAPRSNHLQRWIKVELPSKSVRHWRPSKWAIKWVLLSAVKRFVRHQPNTTNHLAQIKGQWAEFSQSVRPPMPRCLPGFPRVSKCSSFKALKHSSQRPLIKVNAQASTQCSTMFRLSRPQVTADVLRYPIRSSSSVQGVHVL